MEQALADVRTALERETQRRIQLNRQMELQRQVFSEELERRTLLDQRFATERETLRDALSSARTEIHQLQQDAATRKERIPALEQDLIGRANQISALERRISLLEQEIGDLRSSTSWRVTGPLRRLVRVLRPAAPDAFRRNRPS
ncbi:hypothetical protein [Gluconacetobacter tumulisoli]|uniref:Uncharacterized protein n=1 Tax=Gluconacetobacter tumulisoli TaxID=1286189 RepID=A0A7W4PP40_9PROT|nr:hypothetical protein [Gluconacetobacter tumulisoli]MBB2203214.1 hypothetical protein [Gluconacetobacter tumulisoli]